MSKGIQKTALLALAMWGVALAGGSKNTDTGAAQGSDAVTGSDAASSQAGAAASPGTDGKSQVMTRKQARAARHADIDKAQKQAMDSTKAEFEALEEAKRAGSSAIVSEKVQEEKAKH